MILALFLLAAAPAADRVILLDDVVRVPAGGWRAVAVTLRQRPAIIECQFTVVRGGSGVRLALIPRGDVERFRTGRSRPVLSTAFQRAGGFRYASPRGEYSLVIDNAMEGRGPADVRLRLALLFGGSARPPVVEVPAGRRLVVIALAILFSIVMALTAGRRLWRAFRSPPALKSVFPVW